MTDDERRKAVTELRTLRTSPQALGKALRQQAAETSATEEGLDLTNSAPRRRKPSGKDVKDEAGDLYKELGL